MVNSFRGQEVTYDEEQFGQAFLDDIVVWIGQTLDPGKVFDKADLIGHIREDYYPSEVFDDDELGDWAINNGYVEQGEKA